MPSTERGCIQKQCGCRGQAYVDGTVAVHAYDLQQYRFKIVSRNATDAPYSVDELSHLDGRSMHRRCSGTCTDTVGRVHADAAHHHAVVVERAR